MTICTTIFKSVKVTPAVQILIPDPVLVFYIIDVWIRNIYIIIIVIMYIYIFPFSVDLSFVVPFKTNHYAQSAESLMNENFTQR